MFQCSSCQSVLKGHETLPHVDGSDTVQCIPCHDRSVRDGAYRLAIGKITQALEPFGPAGNRRLFLKGSSSIDWHDAARVLAVAFGLPFEQVSKDVEAAFDPTAGAAP